MDKIIIEKIFDNILNTKTMETKCSRTTLDKKDREAIEYYNEHKDEFKIYKDYSYSKREEIFREHCKLQQKHDFTNEQRAIVSIWGSSGFYKINGKIYNTKHYKEKVKSGLANPKRIDEQIKVLQSAIDDAPRVSANVLTKRDGHWESGHKEGDVIVQKGFASTSYTQGLNASQTSEEYNYDITYIIPKGSKGLLLDDDYFECLGEEELLLGKNTRQYVLSQDDEYKEVEVLVLPDR